MKKLITMMVAVVFLFSSVAAYAAEVTKVTAPADFLISDDGIDYVERLSVKVGDEVYFQATLDMTPVQEKFLADYNMILDLITPEGETEPDADLLAKLRQAAVTGEWTLKLTYPKEIVMPEAILNGSDLEGFNQEARNTFVEVSRGETAGSERKSFEIRIKVKDNCTVAELKDNLETMLYETMTFTGTGVKATAAKTCQFIATFAGTTTIAYNAIAREYAFEGVKDGKTEMPAELVVSKKPFTPDGSIDGSYGGGVTGGVGSPSVIGGDDETDAPADPNETGVAAGLNTKDHFAYIEGYPDGTARPDANITRAEATTMLYRLLNTEVRERIFTKENPFGDVTADLWYNKAISSMSKGSYVEGYEDGNFYGDSSITRAELVTILARFANAKAGEVTFSDVDESHWGYAYIATAVANKWIEGYEDGSFKPEQYITRAETATIINRALNRGVNEIGILAAAKQWPDNPKTEWYYYEMIEATNEHTYTGSRPNERWNTLHTDYVYDIVYYERP